MRIVTRVPRKTADISRGVVSRSRFWHNAIRIVAFFVVLYLLLTWGTTSLVSIMPLSWEEKLQVHVPGSWRQEPPPEDLARVFERVLAESGSARHLELHLVDEDDANAFALVGGHLGVTRGLLKTVTSEEELAFVLAHEIGHFEYRHPLKSVSRSAVLGLAKLILFGNNGIAILSLSENLAELNHSREQESAADRFALGCLYRAYGHVGGATAFFTSMTELPHPPSLLSTHPLPESRIRSIEDRIEEEGYPVRGVTPLSP